MGVEGRVRAYIGESRRGNGRACAEQGAKAGLRRRGFVGVRAVRKERWKCT